MTATASFGGFGIADFMSGIGLTDTIFAALGRGPSERRGLRKNEVPDGQSEDGD